MLETYILSVYKKLYILLSKRGVYHGVVWMFYMIGLLLSDHSEDGFWLIFRNNIIHMFFLILIVYFNYLYLIPKLLSRKSFLIYAAALLVTAALITPVETLFRYGNLWTSSNVESKIQLIENQFSHFILLFFILCLSTIVKISKEWLYQQTVQKELENKNLQSELSFLKSQINPHFLFNTLNSIYALSLKQSDQAPELVLRLSEMMRYMLYKSNEKEVPLEQEIKYIQNYLELEKTRYGKKALIEFVQEGSPDNYKVAPLLFITFLENSFKHGLSQSISEGYVRCQLLLKKGCIHFHLTNSKTVHKDIGYFQGGIGLKNAQRRLDLLYANRYQLNINETEEQYTVSLDIQLY